MSLGLSVSRVVNVLINMSPLAAPRRNFGALLILGSSDIVDTTERIREYNDITSIATDFGTGSAEYKAALLFFSQIPRPSLCYIGRWAQGATKGRLNGGSLSLLNQDIGGFNAITSGTLTLTTDGVSRSLTGLNFSGATNLNGVAAIVQTALAAVATGATVVWDATNDRFQVFSGTTGAASAVGLATGGTTATLLGLNTASGAYAVGGVVAEALDTCVANLMDLSNDWYGLVVATSTQPTTTEHLAVSALIEAGDPSRIYGITTQDSGALIAGTTSDIASRASALEYMRTFVQYSSSNPYAVTSLIGRAFTVDFTGSNTTITLKFKQEPGVAAENLSATQASTLQRKHCNVFVSYNNGTAILQEGVMSNGYFFDSVHGFDAVQNSVQTDVWNLLYTSLTKIPQTDAGTHLLVTTIEKTMVAFVTNGLLAPGVWNAQGFGQLLQGDTLSKGFYVYAPPVATQSQADREARKSVPIQIAAKEAGAIHSVLITVNVNR